MLEIKASTIILSEDTSHGAAQLLHESIEGYELAIVTRAGHASHIEPRLFDSLVLAFPEKHDIIKRSEPAQS